MTDCIFLCRHPTQSTFRWVLGLGSSVVAAEVVVSKAVHYQTSPEAFDGPAKVSRTWREHWRIYPRAVRTPRVRLRLTQKSW